MKDASLDIRFHDLRRICITKLAEGRYSHIRMAAKRNAVDGLVLPVFDGGVAQNGNSREQ